MPTTSVPFDQLGSGAQTTGTWTQESIPAGATGPAAPVLYNDPIDFVGQPVGQYIYKYTVGVSSAYATYNWDGSAVARANSTCATSTYVSSGIPPPFTYTVEEEDSRAICGDQQLSTNQELPLPSSWSLGTYSGDLWYFFRAVAFNQDYIIQFTMTGQPYQNEGIYSPAIEVFLHGASENCAAKVSTSDAASSPASQIVQTSISIPGDLTNRIVRVRVSSLEDNEGKFDLVIEGICP